MTNEELEGIYVEAKGQADRSGESQPSPATQWWVLLGLAVVGACITYTLLRLGVVQ